MRSPMDRGSSHPEQLPTFDRVPGDAAAVARDVLQFAGPDLENVCEALGVEVRAYDFDVADVGTYALLVPLLSGGFVALVAHSIVRDDPLEARMCVGHECAHALFYDRSKAPPPHVAPYPPSPAEEQFCDDFAAELLASEDAPVDRLFAHFTLSPGLETKE